MIVRRKTIQNLIKEFLATQDMPCHRDEIRRYILQFRPCKVGSVMTYRIRTDKLFVRFKTQYLGLRSKNYNLDEWNAQIIRSTGSTKDLAWEFLAKRETPCNIDDIFKYVTEFRKISRYGLLKQLLKDERFISIAPRYIGLWAKTYNLDKWKKQNVAVVGTLSDLIEEFLTGQELPCHIDQIADYILKLRTCKVGNLMWTCSSDDRFMVIKPRYIALRAKKYNLEGWKKENISVVGTLSDIAACFLDEYDTPCHVDEIAKHVNQYRSCTSSEFAVRIKGDSRFVRIARRYYGLRAKKYNLEKWKKETQAGLSIRYLMERFLAKRDTPCRINEIARYVAKYQTCSAEKLRMYCKRDKQFIFIQRGYIGLAANKYNLEEWRKKNISALHTIPDIVYEFLSREDFPCHINSIAKFVLKHRRSNPKAIMIRCRHDKRFLSVMPNYVGLRSKKYDLYEWKKQNITTLGSVCDLAADFISREDSLCYLNTIVRYIQKSRKYSDAWIRHSIRKDFRFVLYTNGYIGLWGRHYEKQAIGKQKIIKAGTLGDLAEQFLAGRKTPCFMDEIIIYVRKFQKSSQNWITAALKEDKRFRVLKNDQIVIKRKLRNPVI